MTREECVQKYKHILWGIMLDVTRCGATGSERSLLEDKAMRKIESLLTAIASEFLPAVPKLATETRKAGT